ncbi:MAG TPA: ABC transporter permease [Actinomycetes bacterium]|jgi:ABC-2 type transport system permease protein|nr:ABC transporter permease [Actinomycetes bacterium]
MMTGYLAYLWLETRRQWRDRQALLFRLGLPTAVYLILVAVQDQPGRSSAGLPWQTGRMVALAALGAVISGLAAGPSLGEERGSGWLRQLRTTPLRPSAAVAAKIAVAMSFALPAIALVAAAGGLTDHVALGWSRWIGLVGLMWLATVPITALGALLGLVFAAQAAQGATNLAFLVLWLLGGIFTSPASLPEGLASVARSLPSYGVVQVGQSAASGDVVPASAMAVLAAWTVGVGALAALAWRRVVAR